MRNKFYIDEIESSTILATTSNAEEEERLSLNVYRVCLKNLEELIIEGASKSLIRQKKKELVTIEQIALKNLLNRERIRLLFDPSETVALLYLQKQKKKELKTQKNAFSKLKKYDSKMQRKEKRKNWNSELIIAISILAVITAIIVTSLVVVLVNAPHKHRYSRKWSYSSTYHWHDSLCDCDLMSDWSSHKDEDENGYCDICKYKINK